MHIWKGRKDSKCQCEKQCHNNNEKYDNVMMTEDSDSK